MVPGLRPALGAVLIFAGLQTSQGRPRAQAFAYDWDHGRAVIEVIIYPEAQSRAKDEAELRRSLEPDATARGLGNFVAVVRSADPNVRSRIVASLDRLVP